MSKEDSHVVSFNLSSSIKSYTRIPSMCPKDYEVWVSHFKDYILGTKKHRSNICKSIAKGPHWCTKWNEFVNTLGDYVDICGRFKDLTTKEKDKIEGDLRAKIDLRFTFPLDTFILVSSFDTVTPGFLGSSFVLCKIVVSGFYFDHDMVSLL